VLTILGGEDDGVDALDLHVGGIPKLDGASDIGVKPSEELPSTGHVMGGAGVEAPPISLVAAGTITEEGVCSRFIKVEESRCDRCLHVLGAELAPPPPPVRRGSGRVMAVDTPWPNGQACHSCGRRRLVPASGCRRRHRVRLRGRYPRHVLAPRLGRLRATCAACRACGRSSREGTPPSSRHPGRPLTIPE
jgi:hypothetical protein